MLVCLIVEFGSGRRGKNAAIEGKRYNIIEYG
jgi:hypothetical protein